MQYIKNIFVISLMIMSGVLIGAQNIKKNPTIKRDLNKKRPPVPIFLPDEKPKYFPVKMTESFGLNFKGLTKDSLQKMLGHNVPTTTKVKFFYIFK